MGRGDVGRGGGGGGAAGAVGHITIHYSHEPGGISARSFSSAFSFCETSALSLSFACAWMVGKIQDLAC